MCGGSAAKAKSQCLTFEVMLNWAGVWRARYVHLCCFLPWLLLLAVVVALVEAVAVSCEQHPWRFE